MVNWISKYIKPKLKSIFKKRSAENDEALWQNCSCSKLTLKEDFEKNLFVCPSCKKPHPLNNKQRFELFLDDSEYQIIDYGKKKDFPTEDKPDKTYICDGLNCNIFFSIDSFLSSEYFIKFILFKTLSLYKFFKFIFVVDLVKPNTLKFFFIK